MKRTCYAHAGTLCAQTGRPVPRPFAGGRASGASPATVRGTGLTLAIAMMLSALTLGGCVDDLGDLAGDGLLGGDATAKTLEGFGGAGLQIDSQVSGDGDYRLFELGHGAAGERWQINGTASGEGWLVVAVFDAQMRLLLQSRLRGVVALDLALHESTDRLIFGVAAVGGSARANLSVASRGVSKAPSARAQTVWLNFGAAQNIRIADAAPVSFAAFEASMAGGIYGGRSAEMKAAIVATIREHYAPFHVEVLTSDETPEPGYPHSTVFFGGNSLSLLGLADRVDAGNTSVSDAAVVYVEAFAKYSGMGLTAERMGRMIGNAASHEIGHLLGLHHTASPGNVMDTTGNAWNMAATRVFELSPLEARIFPTGSEDSPWVLEKTVGRRADYVPPAVNAAAAKGEMLEAAVMKLVDMPMEHECGTCNRH